MALYKSHQIEGGTDTWVVTHADADFDKLSPTFITVLGCDTILTKDSPKEMADSAKYLGPMYFDLDADDDVTPAIDGANALILKLVGFGLTEADIEIYLSGKKGLHILVQPQVFMQKPVPVWRLPAIYKEIAFKLAVDTLDFAVYSARRGRMFRTCYNVRENGNYKVPITWAELKALTAESYSSLCKTKRTQPTFAPSYRPQFAILYETIAQRIHAAKKIKHKPVDSATLRKHLPIIKRVMNGDRLVPGLGFNKIAIQLGIYAHEAKLSEDTLITECAGLITKHQGDGYRYNTARKREAELRRMFNYLEEGNGYDYAIGPIQVMLQREDEFADSDEPIDAEEFVTDETDSGIYIKRGNYFVAGEQADKHIMNAVFEDCYALKSPEDEQLSCLFAVIKVVGSVPRNIPLELKSFNSSSSLHNAVNRFGASFTGTDVHARYIYTRMVKETKTNGKSVYVTEKEGLNVINMPFSDIPEAREPFIVWTDPTGVRIPPELAAKGLDIRFIGYPQPEGLMKTDLAKAPSFPDWVLEGSNREDMLTMLRGMLTCQDPSILSKMLGWMVACFYIQLFRKKYSKFPLMHINGSAGSGKTEMTKSMMKMFYYQGDPVITSPASTSFSLAQQIGASASIPLILDEYKPSSMGLTKHEEVKQLFRTSYNGSTYTRGGGNRQSENVGALTIVKLTGPITFIAEAVETENAILERSVLITLRRPSGMLSIRYLPRWKAFQNNDRCLSIIGQHIAASIIQNYSIESFFAEYDPIYKEAIRIFLPNSGDVVGSDQSNRKVNINERIVFNHSVASFGLSKLKQTVLKMFPEENEELGTLFAHLEKNIYHNMEQVVEQTTPEYIKVLRCMSDMTRFSDNDRCKLTNKLEYELRNIDHISTLVLVVRTGYNKYREYCRRLNEPPMFSNEGAFLHALKNSHLYISMGGGTTRLITETITLNYDEMLRLGVDAFSK